MNYISAKDVLPMEIIKQIQCYVDGQIIYIPKSKPKKKGRTILMGFQLSNSPKSIFLWKKVFKELYGKKKQRTYSQRPRSKLTGHQNSSAASCGVFDPRGSRQISMQAWLLGSLLRGNKEMCHVNNVAHLLL